MAEDRPKDAWDKFEIITKFLSAFVLAAIPVVIGVGAGRIADAARESQLIQSLLEDLTTRDRNARQNIALLALDHAVAEDERGDRLVADIAFQVWTDRASYSNEERDIAIRIMRKRNPTLVATEIDNAERAADYAATTEIRQEIISRADPSEENPVRPTTETRPPPEAEIIARAYPDNIIYIQFNPGEDPFRTIFLMNGLRTHLTASGELNVPQHEIIESDFQNTVRYFRDEDEPLAAQVAGETETYLTDNGWEGPSFDIVKLTSKQTLQEGHIEIWANFENAQLENP